MECMTIIPHDILRDILCRLPTKPLARFRCISKEWLSLLSEPRFIQTHQKKLNRNRFIFGSDDGSLYSVVPYKNHEAMSTLTKLHLEFYQIISILGSVNGLVLASAYKNLHKYYTLLVLNLTTKDYVELPVSGQKHFLGMKGFGYDSVSDDYQVVTISKFGKYYGNVFVYSLKTKTWKQLSDSPYNYNYTELSGVFVNGFLHWIGSIHSKPIIVAFSLADENFSELPSPNLYNEVNILSDVDTKLVAIGEKLAIFNEVKGDVWLMNEYGIQKSWTKIVVNGFNKIPIIRPKVYYDDGKVLFRTRDLLQIYDVEERTFCKSVDIPHMNILYFVSSYAESLISPKFSRSK